MLFAEEVVKILTVWVPSSKPSGMDDFVRKIQTLVLTLILFSTIFKVLNCSYS